MTIVSTEYNSKSKIKRTYLDDNGVEIHEGDTVLLNGKEELVYLTKDDKLGTDATNPSWIKNGRAVPCEYGIYPFNWCDSVVLVRRKDEYEIS